MLLAQGGVDALSAVLGGLLCVAVAASIALLAWPWRVEATARVAGDASMVSVAGGADVAGFSASLAAILGGPGVVALHLRGRELWRRAVSIEGLLDWLDEVAARQPEPDGRLGRLRKRATSWLVARTDVGDLPELGLRILAGLRDRSLHGAITCGHPDPAVTGKLAALLYPIAAVLAPLGELEVHLDWTGKSKVDGAVDLGFRVTLARLALECLRFVVHHVHPLRVIVASSTPTEV